jgi:hypothetical protein
MTQRQRRSTTQTIAFVFTAIVALSMILSLLGPIFLRSPSQPTPTPPPTWTPLPTYTPTPVITDTPTPEPTSTETVPLGPLNPTATPSSEGGVSVPDPLVHAARP